MATGGQGVRRVGIEFTAKGNLPKVLTDLCQKLREADRLTARWKASLAQFEATSLRNTSRIAANIGRVNQALQMGARVRLAELATENKRLSLVTRMAGEERKNALAAQVQAHRQEIHAERLNRERLRTLALEERIHRQLQHQSADQEHLLNLARRAVGTLPVSGNLVTGGLAIARWGLAPGRAALGLGHDEAVRHFLHERSSLEQMNLGAAGNRQAFAAAEGVRQRVRGLDSADAIDVIKDLVNITGSVQEATHGPLAEMLARFRVSNRVAYGLTTNEGYSAIKAAEMLTSQRKGMTAEEREAEVASRLELINKVMGGSGGKIRPGEILQFAKTSQAAKFSLSEQGIYHLAPIMQEMGGMRTGTSLVSVMQNLANGRMTHASAQNLLAMGLLDPKMVEYDKVGRAKRVLPGATVDSDLLREDPVTWVEKHILPKLRGKSQAQQDQVINSILSNRTAAGLVATIVAQDARIQKDTRLYQGSRSIAEGDAAQNDNYLRAETDYQKALDTLRQKLSVIILPSLTRGIAALTELIEGLNRTLENHPLLSKIGVGGIIGGGALVSVAGTVAGIVGTIRVIGTLGGAARVLGLVAAELAAINAAGGAGLGAAGAGAAGAAEAGAAGAVGAAAGGRLAALRGALGRGVASAGSRLAAFRGAAGAGLASLGAFGATPVAAAGAAPIIVTVGTGALVGAGAGNLIQRLLEHTGAADAIQSSLAGLFPKGGTFTAEQQRRLEVLVLRNRAERAAHHLGSGNLTLVVNGPIHTTASDTQGLVRDLARAAARSGTIPRGGPLSPFAYP